MQIDFPIAPQIFSETIPIDGYAVNMTFSMSLSNSGVYALIALELGDLKDSIGEHMSNFFNAMLTYIINDFGAEVETFTDFEYKGNDFLVLTLKSELNENSSSKGKTLLIEDRGYIWFGIIYGEDSANNVDQFVNSYNIK